MLFFALGLWQVTSTSPTFDEGFTVLRGYAAWQTGYLVPIGHPPLAHWLSGASVLLEPNLPSPPSLTGWAGDHYDDSSRHLLWQSGLNAGRMVFLARLPTLLLGVALGALTARWALGLFGWRAALLAVALHALSPNMLAHSSVATTDLPVAAMFALALFCWQRFANRPTKTRGALLGVSLGLALAAKFSALLLLPILGLLALLRRHKTREPFSVLLRQGIIVGAMAFLTLWLNYGFALAPFPLAQFWRELTDLTTLASEGHTAYLLGKLSANGWWYYHPFVFLVKTPLPLLLLTGFACWHLSKWRARGLMPVAAGLIVYLIAASVTSLNVGYRYLLPILPLLHVLVGSVVRTRPTLSVAPSNHNRSLLVIVPLLIWHVIGTLAVAPHFIAYFNETVSPENGYKVLVDSNLDWGQDLPALSRYLNGRHVYLSYFGQADPAYYNIGYTPLPGWPPPDNTRFSPADPLPGLYAISASNLVGAQLYEPNDFAYFRLRQPLAVINYSIFIYEVEDRPPVESLAQCSPPLLSQTATLLQQPVRQMLFNCSLSVVIPASPALLLFPAELQPILELGAPTYAWTRSDGAVYYRLYRTDGWQLTDAPLHPDPVLSLLSYTLTQDHLTLVWRVETPPPPPVSIFVHFNWEDGALAEAYDALGVPAEFWQSGDVIIQRHTISPDLPSAEYGVRVGLYSLADGTRYSDIALTTYKK